MTYTNPIDTTPGKRPPVDPGQFAEPKPGDWSSPYGPFGTAPYSVNPVTGKPNPFPGGPGGPTSTPTPTPASDPNASAKQILVHATHLDDMGLTSLADWAWQTYITAGGGTLGQDLVNAELHDQQAFKDRFPAISQRVGKGLPAITPADYMNYETTIRQAFIAHGLPMPTTGNAFNSLITGLLGNDVSASEVVNQRIGSAYNRVANAPVEVQNAAYQLWGVNGQQALAASFLDPTSSAPEIEKMSQQAEIMGTGQRFGIDINAARSARLQSIGADQNLGQFQKLATLSPLFRANAGEDPSLTEAGAGVSAVFGEDANSAAAVQRRLQLRQAGMSGGGQPYTQSALSQTPGVSGLGVGPV